MNKRKLGVLTMAVLIVLAVLLALSGKPRPEMTSGALVQVQAADPSKLETLSAERQNQLVVALPRLSAGRYPFVNDDDAGALLTNLVYQPLCQVNRQGELDYVLAESIRPLDERRMQIKLKSGLTFSDGEPLTSTGIAESWKWFLRTQYENAWTARLTRLSGAQEYRSGAQDELEGIEILNDQELIMIFTDGDFHNYEALLLPIVHSNSVSVTESRQLPAGTGPYQIEKLIPSQQITLIPSPGRETQVPVSSVLLTTRSYGSGYQNHLEDQSIDLWRISGEDELEAVKNHGAYDLYKLHGSEITVLMFNLFNPDMAELKNRRAVSQLISREGIARASQYSNLAQGIIAADLPEPNFSSLTPYQPSAASILKDASIQELQMAYVPDASLTVLFEQLTADLKKADITLTGTILPYDLTGPVTQAEDIAFYLSKQDSVSLLQQAAENMPDAWAVFAEQNAGKELRTMPALAEQWLSEQAVCVPLLVETDYAAVLGNRSALWILSGLD